MVFLAGSSMVEIARQKVKREERRDSELSKITQATQQMDEDLNRFGTSGLPDNKAGTRRLKCVVICTCTTHRDFNRTSAIRLVSLLNKFITTLYFAISYTPTGFPHNIMI
jgi:hypothetical protein